nr:hypothetical protein CFP56_36464 [Quercus suber]
MSSTAIDLPFDQWFSHALATTHLLGAKRRSLCRVCLHQLHAQSDICFGVACLPPHTPGCPAAPVTPPLRLLMLRSGMLVFILFYGSLPVAWS